MAAAAIPPLHRACRDGDLPRARSLLETSEINLTDPTGFTPLHFACARGRTVSEHSTLPPSSLSPNLAVTHEMRPPPQQAVARLLLDREATIDYADNEGCTSLYYGVRNGHEAVVRLLLERGAEIDDARNDGRSSLYAAS